MPYIGRSPTNSGQFANIDEISGSFNGSTTSFDLKVGTIAQTPDPANTIIALNGVLQHFPEAYTISGSKIIFSESPPADTKFYGLITGESQYIRNGSISDLHVAVGAAISGSKISFDNTNQGSVTASNGGFNISASQFTITASSGFHITGSTTVSGGNLTLVGSTFSASQARHPDSATGSVEYVKYVHTGSFASGSDLQIIKAESASYVVSTNTGSFASGSDFQASTTLGDSIASIHRRTGSFEVSASRFEITASEGVHVTGSMNVSGGALTAENFGGNVSGSLTSTGSFGSVVAADTIYGQVATAAQTNITSLLATDIKIGEDDQTKIDFETANEIHFYADNTEQVYLGDNIFGPQSDSDVDLGSTGVRWKDAYVDSVTSTGTISAASITTTGDISTSGSVFAREFHTEFTSASVVYASGSNKFGDTLDDKHEFTGSIEATGSLLTIDNVGGVSGSITSTGSFGVLRAGDIELENERGHWRIIEESEYLSIHNVKSGKKYKFVLEEIE